MSASDFSDEARAERLAAATMILTRLKDAALAIGQRPPAIFTAQDILEVLDELRDDGAVGRRLCEALDVEPDEAPVLDEAEAALVAATLTAMGMERLQ